MVVRTEHKRVGNKLFSEGGCSYAAMVQNRMDVPERAEVDLVYNCDISEALQRFSKAYVRKVFEVGMSYNM